MTCPRDIDVGAYVLDALEPEERSRMRGHLADCPICAASLRELEPLPGWLALVPPPTGLPEDPVPSELAFRRLHRSATAAGALPATRRPQRRRFLAVAAAAVAVGAAGLTGVVVATSGGGPTTVAASAGPVHATASIAQEGSGSSITLTLRGVPTGEECRLVAVGKNGERDSTRSWTVGYTGDVSWRGTVALRPDQLDRLAVVTDDGRTLVALPV